jgi:hypothetical protein
VFNPKRPKPLILKVFRANAMATAEEIVDEDATILELWEKPGRVRLAHL